MKIHYLTFTMLCFAALLSQCQTAKYSAEQLPEDHLRFGNGGGFTGIETTYILLENGQIFKSVTKKSGLEELKSCKRKSVKTLFEQAEDLDLAKLEFMYPGNIYQFLEIRDDGKINRIAWGEKDNPVDSKIKDFHASLMQLITENK